MAEDVDEEPAVGGQPAGDPGEQRLVVAHVLEHLDRDDAIEALAGLERVHVAR